MKHITTCLLAAFLLLSCKQKLPNDATTVSQSFDKLNAVDTDKEIACKLTSLELQTRKAGAVAELKKKILETVETEHGYAFRFAGSDETLGQLMVFIQAERKCCDFFTFKLGIQDPESPIWLEISGASGAKSFVRDELDL
ncbi:MAG: hypothetical protein L6Q97_17205 [Thermoanaerobaculia bacterium]|nr:hypothetical protein [Thermoanaerobaculia bacterium]